MLLLLLTSWLSPYVAVEVRSIAQEIVPLQQLASHSRVYEDSLIRYVWSHHREKVVDYHRLAFRHIREKPFLAALEQAIEKGLTDEEIYDTLARTLHDAYYGPHLAAHFLSETDKNEKKTLASHLQELLGAKTPLQGYGEMGYPGGFFSHFPKRLKIQEPLYTLREAHLIHDLPPNGLDCFVCYNGLHTLPETEVAPFLASLYRALRPGGSLILREYDAKIPELLHVTSALTRLVYGLEPLTSEPHFRPLADWIALAEAAGFKAHPPLFRRGDPTLQAMIKLEK